MTQLAEKPTVFANVLAFPFLSWLGLARTFNLIYLLNVALSGFGAYLLIRKITQRPAESFIGGLLFMWSPFLVTRAMGHFSLVAAAPLPIFVLSLCLGYAYERTRNLWVPIFMHAAFNASSVVMFLFFR